MLLCWPPPRETPPTVTRRGVYLIPANTIRGVATDASRKYLGADVIGTRDP